LVPPAKAWAAEARPEPSAMPVTDAPSDFKNCAREMDMAMEANVWLETGQAEKQQG